MNQTIWRSPLGHPTIVDMGKSFPKTYYPVCLDLEDQRVLVVGGGKIAEGKIRPLLDAAANVLLVSPDITSEIRAYADSGRITWVNRTFIEADLDRAFIVIAATDDRPVNASIAGAARARGIMVNAVDDPPYCDYIAMSIVERGNLQIAISTGGRSPAMARWVRERFETLLPEVYGPLLEILGGIRLELKERGQVPPYPGWNEAITASVLDAISGGDLANARDLIRHELFQCCNSVQKCNSANRCLRRINSDSAEGPELSRPEPAIAL